ncbi:MAG TPA: FAD-linked oxidase C-terminal domain-containing protein [Xanthobacteraceae bacterium]|jgi:D-lactate dehydrogenase (cytochrome)
MLSSPHRDPQAISAALAQLRAKFGERLTEAESVRIQHGNQLSEVPNQPPDAVVFPETTDDVAEAVRVCAAHRVAIIPFGVGSSFEGHVNAPFGGVSIDTSHMKRILAVHADDLDCVIEAGVTRTELNRHLRDTGLFFPIDPGADASLGGMVATRASGTNAVRYGTMKDNVLALTIVLPDGRVARTGSRARKSSAGYDLTRLIVGSEGTLAVITEITLRLAGIPEEISGGVCPFPSIEAACEAVITTIQAGIPVARIELMDELHVHACNVHSKLDLPEMPLLFLEFHGSAAGVAEQSVRFNEIAAEAGGGPFTWATKPEERSRLWHARHNAYWASRALRPTAKGISTDVCVPISQLALCVAETKADIAASGLVAPIVGHVGDGNFHVMPLVDFNDPAEVKRGYAFIDRLVQRALTHGGTSTGEHGIGQSNRKYMSLEHDPPALGMMRAVKQAIDPDNIMNPGKTLPDAQD